MKHSAIMAAVILGSTALAGAPSAHAEANAGTPSSTQGGTQKARQGNDGSLDLNGTQQQGSISVMPAADLIGRPVIGSRGHNAGQIVSTIVDINNAAIEYAVIGGRDRFGLNGQVVAVPWRTMHPGLGYGAVRLDVTARQVANAPRINRNGLYRLTGNAWRSRVYGYYGYRYGRTALDAPPCNGAAYGAAGQPAGQYGGNCAYPGSPANSGHVGNGANSGGNNGNQSQNSSTASIGNQGAASGNAAGNGALAVTRNGIQSLLSKASAVSPRGLRNANVYAKSGDLIGNIDHVMIDVDNGRIAFVLVKRGGFLGLNPTWYAIPLEALNWSAYGNGFRLDVNQQQLRGLPTIPAINGNLETTVPRGQLTRLYQHFDVQPYWQAHNDRNASGNQNGGANSATQTK